MSCDDNKEARAKDRQKRRSLPIVTAEAPRPSTATAAGAPPRYWRSIEEREAAKAIALGAVNEFPPGADELAEGSVSRRGFMQLLGASTAQRGKYELMAMGVHWPLLDEDLSIAGMLKGQRAK